MSQKWIKALDGRLANRVFALKGRVVIGRGDDADIQVDDALASRQHACIFERDNGQMMIADLSSTNGTWLTDRSIHQHRLVDGDEFTVGNQRFVYIEGAHPGEPTKPPPMDGVATSELLTEEKPEGLAGVGTIADVGSMVKMLRHRRSEAKHEPGPGCGDPLHEKAVVYGWRFCPTCGEDLG